MLEGRINKCPNCDRYIGHHTIDTVFKNNHCKQCKEDYRFLNVNESKDKKGNDVLVWKMTGTTVVAGIYPKFAKDIIKSRK